MMKEVRRNLFELDQTQDCWIERPVCRKRQSLQGMSNLSGKLSYQNFLLLQISCRLQKG